MASRADELKAGWMKGAAGVWEELDSLFRSGEAPTAPPQGDHAGTLLATRTMPPLDALARAVDRQGLWWLGKSFDPGRSIGENRFDRRFRRVVRLLWPLYPGLRDDPSGELRAFTFRTWLGPGVLDPDRPVLKIDYAAREIRPRNPLAVRHVLDELVQVAPGDYVGKAHLRLPTGRWHTVAYFGLRPEGGRFWTTKTQRTQRRTHRNSRS